MTKDEALDLALEALEELQPDDAYPYSLQSKAITAIKQARSAPVQEPAAFNAGVPPLYPEMKDGETISVEYTTPPAQRQWVGLTDEEFEDIELGCRSTPFGKIEAMRKVEAKLKEKNGGVV
jgi:hypothetical protein